MKLTKVGPVGIEPTTHRLKVCGEFALVAPFLNCDAPFAGHPVTLRSELKVLLVLKKKNSRVNVFNQLSFYL